LKEEVHDCRWEVGHDSLLEAGRDCRWAKDAAVVCRDALEQRLPAWPHPAGRDVVGPEPESVERTCQTEESDLLFAMAAHAEPGAVRVWVPKVPAFAEQGWPVALRLLEMPELVMEPQAELEAQPA
jgi:hypothetical protein